MKEITGFKGHIVLFCKHHYGDTSNLVEKLKMIWAIRCGYPYSETDNSVLRIIANELYSIILEYSSKDAKWLQELVHERITSWIYADQKPINSLIIFYCCEIMNIQVKEKVTENKWKTLIKLPKPQKRLFKRILSGKGKYEDYKLVK